MRPSHRAGMVLLGALAASTVLADGGRIPIAGQTVITAPGVYVLTRDVSAAAGATLQIDADDVTLDLNGHEVSHQNSNVSVVAVSGNDATIRNGRISGGGRGIHYAGAVPIRIRVENVVIRGQQYGGLIVDDAEHLAVRSSRFQDITGGAAIGASGVSQGFSARIVDNTILDCALGISTYGMQQAELRGNVILGTTSSIIAAIHLDADPAWNAGGNLISRNLLRGGNAAGIELEAATADNVVEGNTVSSNGGSGIVAWSRGNDIRRNACSANGAGGIFVFGDLNRIRDNLALLNSTDGIAVGGQHQLVENNLSEGNGGAGIAFSGSGHAHLGNMLRDNTGGAVIGGANSTDAGGNIP